MRKSFVFIMCFVISLPVVANSETKRVITKDELSKICAITPNSYRYSEGGFPFIQDKYKVKVNDFNCGIKANIVIYKFISESFAKSKFIDLKESHLSININLKPIDGNNYRVMWESETNTKMVFLRKQGEFVFSVAINANQKYYEKLKQLMLKKYDGI